MRLVITRILDTNVLLDRPLREVIDSFEPCKLVLPFAVIKELDKFKIDQNEVLRYNARAASNYLDRIRKLGRLDEGVELDSGHIIKVELNHATMELPIELNAEYVDYRILKVALGLQSEGEDVVLVTQDTNERLLADVLGIKSENYGDVDNCGPLYAGWEVLPLPPDAFSILASKKELYISECPSLASLIENEYVIAANEANPKQTLRTKYKDDKISVFDPSGVPVYGIKPLNLQQRFLLDLLMDPEIKVVTAVGGAGSGKTLLALAAGMEQTKQIGDIDIYNKIMVTRSPIPMGKDIGYLPGSELEKISPWLSSIYDNLEFLFGGSAEATATADLFVSKKVIDLKAMTYIRGRSIPNQYIIIDEAQNLTKEEIKTIVSRVAKNTKIIIIGDIEQIDNFRLSATNNGLVHLIEAFKGLPFYGHVTLTKTERSDVADAAVKLL
jgi:PhoH-like ATPase